ncbi:hypothetical protein [Streptomyces flavofungini]|uniref:hypothetical protein n=1 Tax=Streptomyces flavofungini TaxID=68200 RepID=UPI0025AFCE0A|nr:hypothetical protein [Streptomyces flavofungini]WJV50886.1 hypothetical protein QUY26_38500 [Streptomyces flavofungini]
MDAAAAGAADLMAALNEAVVDFQSYGYDQFLAHQSAVTPRYGGIMPPAAQAHVSVGVSFDLVGGARPDGRREARVSVQVGLRDGMFVVAGEAGVDAPGYSDELWELLRELPEVAVQDLDECVALIRDYTARLCAYTDFLDGIGVPRTSERPGRAS